MTLTLLKDLYEHMEWADSLVWKEIRAAQSGARDPALFDTLLHLHSAQRAFMMVWRHEPLDMSAAEQLTTYEGLHGWAQAYYRSAAAFIRELRDNDLNSRLDLPWASRIGERLGRSPAPTTLGETLYQVVSHCTYHRGQINRRLREVGGEPPFVDYIAWVWLGRPPAEWHD
jgi:uncharacterized damage-inducible protein DinB